MELKLAVLVRDLVLVIRINLDLLLRHKMVVHAEDRTWRADVVPQAVADHRAALDPRGEVEVVTVAQRSQRGLDQVREGLEEQRNLRIRTGRGDVDGAAV